MEILSTKALNITPLLLFLARTKAASLENRLSKLGLIYCTSTIINRPLVNPLIMSGWMRSRVQSASSKAAQVNTPAATSPLSRKRKR